MGTSTSDEANELRKLYIILARRYRATGGTFEQQLKLRTLRSQIEKAQDSYESRWRDRYAAIFDSSTQATGALSAGYEEGKEEFYDKAEETGKDIAGFTRNTDSISNLQQIPHEYGAPSSQTPGERLGEVTTDVSGTAMRGGAVLIANYAEGEAFQLAIIRPYQEARKVTAGLRGQYQAHHILESRHLRNWGLSSEIGNAPSIILSKTEHKLIGEALQSALPYGKAYSREAVWAAYQKVYANYPEWLAAVAKYFE